MTGRMQMLVGDEWVDVTGVSRVTFDTSTPEHPDDREALRDRLDPEPTSWSMSFDVKPEDAEGLDALLRRLEHEALLARWRARKWLTHPYRPKPPNGC